LPASSAERQIWRDAPVPFLTLARATRRVRVMDSWTWSDPRWRDRIGADAEATAREALRRAVDLRDTLAEAGSGNTARALFLVDVLNHLAELQGFDTSALWERP
jgi:hypothetical protein